jgi:hypothetical protein
MIESRIVDDGVIVVVVVVVEPSDVFVSVGVLFGVDSKSSSSSRRKISR